MSELGLLAVALVLGVPPLHAGLTALAIAAPLPAGVIVGFLGLRSYRVGPDAGSAGRLLLELAGSLRAGLSLRAAIAAAGAEQVGARAVRLATSGRPMEEVSMALEAASIELVAAVGLAGRVGGSIAEALEALASEEMAEAEARKEVRAAAAPMVMQALIVGGIPAGAVLYRLWSGSLIEALTRADFTSGVSAAGIAAIAIGSAWIVALVRGAMA